MMLWKLLQEGECLMENSFKEDLNRIYKGDFTRLIKLKEMIDRLQGNICRGEVNILDENNQLLVQMHYEYFTIYFTPEIVKLDRRNGKSDAITLDYTSISTDRIERYEIKSTTLTLYGKLSENINIKILAVLEGFE